MWDVVVIGAGPGGCAAGFSLAKQGLKVLLLERKGAGRFKPCAGGLSGATLRILSGLGIGVPDGWDCFGLRMVWRGARYEVAAPRPVGLIVERAALDKHLADAAQRAGVQILWRNPARAIRRFPDRLVVAAADGEHPCRAVICADGTCGTVSSQVAQHRYSKDEMVVVIVASVEADARRVAQRCGNLIEIHFDTPFCGYGWVFPQPGHFNIGAGALWESPQTPVVLRHFVEQLLESVGRRSAKLHYWWIPPQRMRTSKVGGAFLVGDAAGLADHFGGEGIRYAVMSGVAAADVVAAGLKRKRLLGISDVWRYEACLRRLLRRHLIWAQILGFFVHSRRVFRPFASDTHAFKRFLDVVAGRADYARFVGYLFSRLPILPLKIWLERAGGNG